VRRAAELKGVFISESKHTPRRYADPSSNQCAYRSRAVKRRRKQLDTSADLGAQVALRLLASAPPPSISVSVSQTQSRSPALRSPVSPPARRAISLSAPANAISSPSRRSLPLVLTPNDLTETSQRSLYADKWAMEYCELLVPSHMNQLLVPSHMARISILVPIFSHASSK
jgi:hypothetical protein